MNVIIKPLTPELAADYFDFFEYLLGCDLQFERGKGYWADKLYWMIKYKGEYICFILINDGKDNTEPDGWVIWLDGGGSDWLADNSPDEHLKEILRETPTDADIEAIHSSKWYKQLADEQWDDGSWGRFHSQDSKATKKQKFVTTENALGRARQLSLTKGDPVIEKCIKKMERYVSGEETWMDNIEMHKDKGKSHLFCRPYMTAAVINTFDSDNPLIKSLRDNALKSLVKAFATGFFDGKVWEQDVREYRIPSIAGTGMYGIMLFSKLRLHG